MVEVEFDLPAVFKSVSLHSGVAPLEACRAEYERNGAVDDGTLYWRSDNDGLVFGLALEPDAGITEPALINACEIAVVDAIGAVSPPQLPVQTIDGAVCVDGCKIGRITLERVKDQGSPYLVEVELPLRPTANARSSLADCGAGEISAREILPVIARQMIDWLGRLEDQGAEPINAAWQARHVGKTID